tara:strand:+ start:396 stop:569 length:174 start_codon:yes stop_codon:yes gene_type:complete
MYSLEIGMRKTDYSLREKLEGIGLIIAILTVVGLVECVVLADYTPPKQDMPGVFHLR